MSLQVQALSYIHPNKDILFQNISFSISASDKCVIVGNNGIGKSTLLKIIVGQLTPATGQVLCDESPYMIPQHFGQFDTRTVAEALGIADKIKSLSVILDGQGTDQDFRLLNDDWDIQERLSEALTRWHIDYITPDMVMGTLSGGEKTKVFLAGMNMYQPSLVLMDEPTNHLDAKGRALLYEFIRQANCTMLIVSHDRTLLNMLPAVYEMSSEGMQFYPMSYSEYKKTVEAETTAKVTRLHNQQKELAKAEKSARKTMERQQKHASRGEKQSAKKCVARIAMGNLRNKSESSTSRLNKVQQDKLQAINQEVQEIRASIAEYVAIKINIESSVLPSCKRLVQVTNVTFTYNDRSTLWQQFPIHLTIRSGDRIWLQGDNGCGKSTLLKLIAGILQPTSGEVLRSSSLNILYLDQEYSFLNSELTVYGQLETCHSKKPEHELKMLLNRFLFDASTWDKKCGSLSGGERMKLALCWLLICENTPDLIIVDEPTNNIDLSSMDILADTLRSYKGTLLVVSHDEQFVQDVGTEQVVRIA